MLLLSSCGTCTCTCTCNSILGWVLVLPVQILPLVVFLASPASAKLTCQAISVNGDISAA